MRIAAILVAFVASLAFAAAAHAQAAQHHGIPDPITTAELERYAARLMLSDEQRQAIQSLHDDYREQFKSLRETEIDRYIEDVREQGRIAPGSEAWRQLQGRRDRIFSHIRALDDSLFTAIEPMLSDEQSERLPRVRMSRQRVRLTPAALMALSSIEVVDLSELVMEADLTRAERERIDPWIAQYEHRLTRMLEELPPVLISTRQQLHASAEEYRRESRENPEARDEAFQRMVHRNHESQLTVQRRLVAMRVLARQTFFEITPHLSDRAAAQLRNGLVRGAYPWQLRTRLMHSPVETALESMLSRDDLDEPQRQRIGELASHLRQRIEAIIREALERADEFEAAVTTFSSMAEGHWDAEQAFEAEIDALRDRLRAFEDTIIEEAVSLLPAEAATSLVEALPRGRRPAIAAQPDSGREAVAQVPQRRSIHPGGLVSTAIAQRDVTEYARLLKLDDEGRELLRELHEEYLDRVADTVVEPSRQAQVSFGPGQVDSDSMERAAQARRTAMDALERADRVYFDAILEAFPDRSDAAERIRRARERQRYVVSPMARMRSMMHSMGNTGDPTSIDLWRLAVQQNIDLAASPHADEAMRGYEQELAKLLRETFDATLRLSDANTLFFASFSADGTLDDSEEAQQRREAAGEARSEAERALARAEHAIAQLHERTMGELRDLLPSSEADALLLAYRVRAWPQVYRDPGAMEGVLTKTLQMDDLNSQQRERLAELLGEYRAQHLDLTRAMHEAAVELDEARFAQRQGETRPGASGRTHEQFSKLRHDRQELNARTIVALKGILNETQFARLGPMPDPTAQPRPMWMDDGAW